MARCEITGRIDQPTVALRPEGCAVDGRWPTLAFVATDLGRPRRVAVQVCPNAVVVSTRPRLFLCGDQLIMRQKCGRVKVHEECNGENGTKGSRKKGR